MLTNYRHVIILGKSISTRDMRMYGHVILAALLLCTATLSGGTARGQTFNPDTDPSRIRWTRLRETLGPSPVVHGQRFGVILKTPTNEYWRLMAAGYRQRGAADSVKLDIQAAQNETDQQRQLALMQIMIGSRYTALLISPISSFNLQPAIDEATAARIPVVDVDGAVVDSVEHFVGPINREMGAAVANWFIANTPSGGKVAIIEGQAGVFSTVQRSAGFREILRSKRTFEIVSSVSGQWDRQTAYEAAKAIILKTPDLLGIYCNNDTMALGAVDAAKAMHVLDRIRVFGSDGTSAAYASIKSGELTGTVDIFPTMIAEIGLEIAGRLSVKQKVPRVVETPQVLVTRDNIARYDVEDATRRKAILADALATDFTSVR